MVEGGAAGAEGPGGVEDQGQELMGLGAAQERLPVLRGQAGVRGDGGGGFFVSPSTSLRARLRMTKTGRFRRRGAH